MAKGNRRVAASVVAVGLLIGSSLASAGAVGASDAPSTRAGSPVIDTSGVQPAPRELDRLARRARAAARVRVIVSLRARVTPEGDLPPTRAAAQRRAIRIGQDRLAAELAGTGARIVRRFRTLPVVSLDLPPAGVEALRDSEVAASVEEEIPARPSLAQSVPLVRADESNAAGFGGAGKAVAILDTGVDTTHPFVAGRVVHEECFNINANCPNGQQTMTGPGSGAPCTFQATECRHGTHVAGIAAGRHTAGIPFDGVAPDASIIAMNIFSRFTGPLCVEGIDPCALAWPTDQLAALERVYELRDTYSIAAVNMSLGAFLFTSPCPSSGYELAIANLRSAGIATVVSSGNDAATDAISIPACVPGVVSVGSTTKTDTVSSFSNSASFLSLLAPGSSITSSVPGGSTAVFNGTSMAAPHVTGAWAVLRQSAPAASVSKILGALQSTGVPVLDTRNGLTKPRIDVEAARVALRPVIVPGAATVVEGNAGTVTLSIPVSLSAPSGATVSAHYEMADVSATSPADYVPTSGTVTFIPGQTTRTVPVTVKGDTLDEIDEAFLLGFSAPVNATIGGLFGLGIGGIVDDDPLPVLTPGVGSVVEGDSGTTQVSIPVSLSAPSGRVVTVTWLTLDATAHAPGDYSAASGTVTFTPGQTTKTVSVAVNGDAVPEPDEVFLVAFTSPVNAAVGGFYGLGGGVITDDD